MKKQTLMSLVTAVAVGLTFSLAQAADEATKPAPTPPAQTQSAPEKKEAAAEQMTVKGKVEAVGEQFMLKTEDKKEFKLDGKDLKNYVGKEVEVKGQLDKANNTIKVMEIKEAKPAK